MTSSTMTPDAAPSVPSATRGDLHPQDLSRIAQDLQIRKVQVEAVLHLLDEGNTIPFITRYRKERTGGLDEEILRVSTSTLTRQLPCHLVLPSPRGLSAERWNWLV